MSEENVDTEPSAQLDDVSMDNSQPSDPGMAATVEDTVATVEDTVVTSDEQLATEYIAAGEAEAEDMEVETADEVVDEDKTLDEDKAAGEDKAADEEAPTEDVVVVKEEQVEVKKDDNPLKVAGSWFQGLEGSPQQELRQRSTNDMTREESSETEKDMENLDAFSPEPEKCELDDHPDDIASKSPSNSSADDRENIEKKGGVRQQVNTYLGSMVSAKKKVQPVVEDVEDGKKGLDEDSTKPTIGMGQRINTLWGSMKNTSKHSDKDQELELEADDDENAKKRGGWRQRIGTMYRSKYGKLGLIVFAFIVILLCIIGPVVASVTSDTMTTFMKNAGRVEKSLKAQMIKHPSYKGDLYPFGEITLRFDTDDRFLINFRVKGLEERCDACKWTIVEGGTCHEEVLLGNTHYFDSSDPAVYGDPYGGYASYTANEGESETVQTMLNGYNLEETINHAVILYAQDGSQLACGVLKKHGHPMTYPKLYANIKKLPQYAGEVEGKVRIDFYPDKAFHVGHNVKGLPVIDHKSSLAIYTGTSCNEDPGQTFWNAEKMQSDPWVVGNGAWYGADLEGSTNRIGFYLYDAFEYADHIERIVIFKDQMGSSIACGELRDSVNYVWKETEAAITGAMEAGGFFQSSAFPDPVVAGVETVQMIEGAVGGEQDNAV